MAFVAASLIVHTAVTTSRLGTWRATRAISADDAIARSSAGSRRRIRSISTPIGCDEIPATARPPECATEQNSPGAEGRYGWPVGR